MSKVFLLWATARPQEASSAYQEWFGAAKARKDICAYFNTTASPELFELPGVVRVTVDPAKTGICKALHALCTSINPDADDIVVVASDDVKPPQHWDCLVREALTKQRGMLAVSDGWHDHREIIAIPICDGETFGKLNKIIYHPSYHHWWSDNELYLNCLRLGLLVEGKDTIRFEKSHYFAGKRSPDQVDKKIQGWEAEDRKNFHARSKLTTKERLSS